MPIFPKSFIPVYNHLMDYGLISSMHIFYSFDSCIIGIMKMNTHEMANFFCLNSNSTHCWYDTTIALREAEKIEKHAHIGYNIQDNKWEWAITFQAFTKDRVVLWIGPFVRYNHQYQQDYYL